MQGTVVAVLRGGRSSNEHPVSLRTGHAILTSLPEGSYTVRDIYIDREGVWHERGKPTTPERVLPSVDAVLSALHGAYGHSGEVLGLLERYRVPFAGSGALGAHQAMHKAFAREKARELGLLVPRYVFVPHTSDLSRAAGDINRSFMPPVVVGPAFGSSGDSVLVHGFSPVYQALRTCADAGFDAIASERIKGEDAFIGIVEGFRGEPFYALPPMGSKGHERFSRVVVGALGDAARAMHEGLGLRHYSHSRFRLTPKGIYYLSTSAYPPVEGTSPLSRALASVGAGIGEFFEHLLSLAKGERRA